MDSKPLLWRRLPVAAGWAGRRHGHGFTLVELVIVMIILGVLAAYAAPKLVPSDFYAKGFHDETLSILRYAQKAAVAQRRMVCVSFDTASTPNTAVLTLEDPGLTTTPLICNKNLTGPKGDSPATVTARSGTSFGSIKTGTTSISQLIFNGLGQPVSNARTVLTGNTTIDITNAASITIEAVTGYVHD